MTPEQIANMARALADGVAAVDMVDWSGWSDLEHRAAVTLACHLIRERADKGPQRRALALFRSWLSPAEHDEFRRTVHYVTVSGTAGGRYRIFPRTGNTQRIYRHGSRWYGKASFCLHPDLWVPPADVALAHYLNLKTDEAGFLARANEHRTQLWDGAYLRRLNAARRARQTEAA